MTADSFTPLGIRNWCAQQAEQIAPNLPQLSDIRVSIGNYNAATCVNISGFLRKDRRHVNFSGPSVEAAEAEAVKCLAKVS